MRTSLLLLLLSCLLSGRRAVAAEEFPVLSSYRVPGADPARLAQLAALFSLEHRYPDGSFEVQLPAEQAGLLRVLAPEARLLEADSARSARARLASFGPVAASGYRSFEQVQAWIAQQAEAHPELAQRIEYGRSGEGRPLSALRIGASAGKAKPAVLLSAATHGDELITTEVLLHLGARLLAGDDPRLNTLLERLDVYLVPVVNPDGFVRTNRFDGRSDPNRSYPYPGHENARPTPSIAGLLALVERLPLRGSIDFHAFGELIMYPWAYTRAPLSPDWQERFHSLTRHMAGSNRYQYGPISEIIYVAPGSSADYYFWKKSSLSLGIEIGNEKIPSPSEFQAIFASQEESTWRFLEGL